MAANQFTLTLHVYREHTAVVVTHRVTTGRTEARRKLFSTDLPLGVQGMEEMRDDEVLSALVSALNARLT